MFKLYDPTSLVGTDGDLTSWTQLWQYLGNDAVTQCHSLAASFIKAAFNPPSSTPSPSESLEPLVVTEDGEDVTTDYTAVTAVLAICPGGIVLGPSCGDEAS